VILDYQMPEMNGELVAAEMRKTNPRVPILMLSGCESLPENALQLVDEFIAKENPVESLRLAVQPTVEPVAKSESRKTCNREPKPYLDWGTANPSQEPQHESSRTGQSKLLSRPTT